MVSISPLHIHLEQLGGAIGYVPPYFQESHSGAPRWVVQSTRASTAEK